MQKNLIITLSLYFFSLSAIYAQYNFTMQDNVACTSVKNQQRTGTCWSFSTVSFLESELIRMGKPEYDLSEMYIVRNIYGDKARNYVFRQGKANFSEGSLSHDVMRGFKMFGIVPESVYSGKLGENDIHNHSEMEAAMKGMLDGILKQKRPSNKWSDALNCIMDTYIGEAPENFTWQGKSYTPQSFAASLGINPDDYVSLTSYSHHPFYEKCILEIPDNYSNGSYYNIPIDELEAIVANALDKGYTVAWDGDVSEKGFSSKNGIAIIPEDPSRTDVFETPGPEMKVAQTDRQEAFESYATTDDHLMHLTGVAKDQSGTTYYLTKNSWGEVSDYKGFLYMSSSYFRLKTVGIMVHKDAIPQDIAKKLVL